MGASRISLVVPTLGGGGAERVMVTLARAFAERGYRVDLVVGTASGALRPLVEEPVRLVDLGTSRVRSTLVPLVRYLRSARPTSILSTHSHMNVAVVAARRLAGIRTRVVVREASTPSVNLPSQGTQGFRPMMRLVRWAYSAADGVVAVSRGVAQDLVTSVGVDPDRVVVIGNPVLRRELLESAREPLEHPWFVPSAPPVILGVGRLTPAKDFATLIRAFSLVTKERPAHLLILGEGDERPQLEAVVADLGLRDHILLPGFVPNPYAYMARAGVFALSSAWEGLPGALIEAMACGCPVVSTDCPSGPSEILRGGTLGPLVPVGDSQALAGAIVQVLDRPISPDSLTSGAARFDEDVVVEDYLRILTDGA